MGSPAKVVRMLTGDEVAELLALSEQYVARAQRFASSLQRIDLADSTGCADGTA
jgi:carbonic anhydrase/acetyltransferase-like protein (isoleucine patch superfamily)